MTNPKATLIHSYLILCGITLITLHACTPDEENPATKTPKVFDAAIKLVLIDSHPNLQTPIGLTIDDDDHLYVLESHTHTPPTDYAGPVFDRIKKSRELTSDKEPAGWQIFADSITDGMNLTWHENKIYLVQKNQVVVYLDGDDDGRADTKEVLLRMHPPDEVYDHAGLLGIAISTDDHLYVSRGNTGGQRWKIVGQDHSSITGFGDGGNIFRCRLDGTDLQEVATGFWNPFDLTFDQEGRLLVSDNDPDSRGPNRLLHIVPGGNYGYESLYGGTGIHPYLAWNGELPGTLPYAAPLGEAPTGIIDARLTNLFSDSRPRILAQIWEENNIVSIPLEESGESISGTPEILVQGDDSFHPVAFAANSRGDLFLTDWVVRQYPNHGKGKLWRLHRDTKNKFNIREEARSTGAQINPDLTVEEMLTSDDPFRRQRGRERVINTLDSNYVFSLMKHRDTHLNLQGLILAIRMELFVTLESMQELFLKQNEQLNQMSLVYLAKESRTDALKLLENMLLDGQISFNLFDSYLETIRHLQAPFVEGLHAAKDRKDPRIKTPLPESYLWNLISDKDLDIDIRTASIKNLIDPLHHIDELINLAKKERDDQLCQTIMDKTRGIHSESLVSWLINCSNDQSFSEQTRISAIIALSYQEEDYSSKLLSLISHQNEHLRHGVLWYLCDCNDKVIVNHIRNNALKNSLDQAIVKFCHAEDGTTDKTSEKIEEASAERGSIIFHMKRHQCILCHQVKGIGGHYGPDLSQVGRSKSATQLRTAILEPSAEIAPEWQGWYLIDENGKSHMGRQIDVGLNQAKLMHEDGSFITHKNPQSYGVLESSLMPAGLEKKINKQALEDLLQYLLTLK